MPDAREYNHKWYSSFNEKTMTFIINEEGEDEMTIPAKYEVCGTCDGHGSHVNPSIDSQGLTREDFDDDPDFEQDYRAGRYDVPCAECRGRRVVPVVDDTATPEQQVAAEEAQDGHYRDQREQWYERERGY